MKKICMVVPSFTAKGGITSVVNGYKNAFDNTEYDVKFVETYCDGSKIKKIFYFIKGYIKFIFLIIFWNPEIVHVHSSFGASFTRKSIIINTSFFFKKKLINHVHGADFEDFYDNENNKRKDKIKKVYNKCTKIIALSHEWKEKLNKIVPESKITIVENYSLIKHNKAKNSNNYTILFLGFLCERKGCFDVPYVVKEVKKAIPNIKFVLAGSGNKSDENKLKEIIDKNNLEGNVVLPGWVSGKEKNIWLEQADLFFLPSYNEGMPMAILDAMGYALPIVSTNVGGISKIVKNNYNGYIFKPGSVKEFSNAIISIIGNNEQRKEFGNNSVKIIESGYTLEKHIKKVEKIYDEVLNEKNN